MKDTPLVYKGLKAEIEKAKPLHSGLTQSNIDRVFSAAKPHDITKFTINTAYGLSHRNQDAAALNILSVAKFCLLNAVYHNYLITKTYCLDKILECEAKIKVNHHYPREASASQSNQTVQYATAKSSQPQTYERVKSDDSTMLMNQMMMAAVANQVIQNSEDHCHHDNSNNDNCPSSHSNHHNDHHSHHHDDSTYSSSYTQPHTSHDTSSDYHSSIGDGFNSQHVDNSSVYHSGSTLFDNHSSSHDTSSSSHDYSSSSTHDYSSSSHDTSSNNDYSSNSYSM